LPICIEVVSLAFQPNFPDVDVPDGNPDLLPIDTGGSQAPKIAPEPKDLDHTAEYISRIKSRVKVLKQQTLIAMDQAEKSAALSQQVSSLEKQMSVLKLKVVRLEDGILYMIETIKGENEQLICKSRRSPQVVDTHFC
jgi:hypothetical protein